MQKFTDFSENDYLNVGIPKLYDDILTALSNSSGTMFPSNNLQVGMVCYRADQKKAYRLIDLTNDKPTWKLCYDANIEPGIAEVDKKGNIISDYYAPIESVCFAKDKDGDVVMKRE